MKINGDVDRISGVNRIKVESRNSAVKGAPKSDSSGLVDISSTARDLKAMEQDMHNSPDVRMDKVMDLKQRIESGTYEIDTDRLAQALTKFM